jgi:hypothetical protein
MGQNLKTQISLGSLLQVPGAGSLKSAAEEKLAAPGDAYTFWSDLDLELDGMSGGSLLHHIDL